MTYKAVLFDMDGVILDSIPLHYRAAKAAFSSKGYKLTYQQYKQYFAGETDKEGFNRYCAHIGAVSEVETLLIEKARAYQDIASTALLTPCAGVNECLQWLTAQSVPLALVTGSTRGDTELVLGAFDLGATFLAIVTAEDVKRGKPHPEGYLKAASQLGVDPTQCIVIEDSPSGIRAARAANMGCIAVTTTYPADRLGHADIVIDRLAPELLAL